MISRTVIIISSALALFIGAQICMVWNIKPLTSCGSELNENSVPLPLVSAVLQQEDQRFFLHSGIDWSAIRFALEENIEAGKVIYGASTIDMQVASLCYLKEHNHNRWIEKIREMLIVALHFDGLEKSEILRAYLTAAPMGNGSTGFIQASESYFGKDISELDKEEIWSLVLTLRNQHLFNPMVTEVNKKLSTRRYLRLQKAKYKNPEVTSKLKPELERILFIKQQ